MTRKEAMQIIIRGAQKYHTHLQKNLEYGPEGIEVHLQPFLGQLSEAIQVIQHFDVRRVKS